MATQFAAPFDDSPIATALQFRKRNRPGTPDCVDAAYGAGDLAVSVAGGGTSINIANGRHHVQGALYELSGGPLNVAVGANGGGSNRTDFAVLTYDDTHDPGVYGRVLAGAALTQTDTGIYDVPLATWQKTPAGAIQDLVDLRVFRGSVVFPCTSSRRPPNPTRGQIAYEVDTGRHIGWNGTVWSALIEDTGDVAVSVATADWNPAGSNLARMLSGRVELDINVSLKNESGGAVRSITEESIDSGGLKIATVPAGLRPPRTKFFAMVGPGDRIGRLQVQPDGGVFLWQVDGPISSGFVMRETLSYLI